MEKILYSNHTSKKIRCWLLNRVEFLLTPSPILKKNQIDIKGIVFEQPHIYAFVNKKGHNNWTILKPEAIEKSATDSATFKTNLKIKNVIINDGNFYYHDNNTQLYAAISGVNTWINALYDTETISLDLQLDSKKIILWQADKTLAKNIAFTLDTHLEADRNSKKLTLTNTRFSINDIDFLAEGHLLPNKLTNELMVQLKVGLHAPSIATMLALIPPNSIQQDIEVITSGDFYFKTDVNGVFGNGQLPIIQSTLRIANGSLQYKNQPNKIDALTADIECTLDLIHKAKSTVSVNNFSFKSNGANLLLKGQANDVLANAKVSMKWLATLICRNFQKCFLLKKV